MPKAGKTKVAARSTKLIHPQSRKACRLGAREMRKGRVQKVHQETSLKNSVLLDKLMWFQEALDPDKSSYSKTDAEQLVDMYLQRFEEELEQISIINGMKSREGRQHANREDIIDTTKKREEEHFTTCGFEIPDIIDGRNLKMFRAWDGNQKYMGDIKMRRLVRTPERGSTSASDPQSQSSIKREERTSGMDDDDDDDDVLENDVNGDEEDEDEGLEDDLLDSDEEDRNHGLHESIEDEGVESV